MRNHHAAVPVLVGGYWRPAREPAGVFQSVNPSTGEPLPELYPISGRAEIVEAIEAADSTANLLRSLSPVAIAAFLEHFAELIESSRDALVTMAHQETGLPSEARLAATELPRTTSQLRQAATAAQELTWTQPVIDTRTNIRSVYAPLGQPVVVFGPNNFPFAFNASAGGDFAAAIAARNPVIAKANPGHPGTTRLFAELALQALQQTALPTATVQLLYRMPAEVGLALVAHPQVGATAFTGSKRAGLRLKEAADRAGNLIYLEMSSVNPVFVLPGALEERPEAIAGEFFSSCTMGSGQFCTNPGLVILPASTGGEAFVRKAAELFASGEPGILLDESGLTTLVAALRTLVEHGAELITGGQPREGKGFRFANTLLRVCGQQFLQQPQALQTEAYGPASLLVVANGLEEILAIAGQLEGSLTGTIYSHSGEHDDPFYRILEPMVRQRVGRLLNDKMPTGVAVSPAMQHGGPFPATGHPGFTAVGIPASIRRFTVLQSYDNVRQSRLPAELRDQNPTGRLWRVIDGIWTTADVAAGEVADGV